MCLLPALGTTKSGEYDKGNDPSKRHTMSHPPARIPSTEENPRKFKKISKVIITIILLIKIIPTLKPNNNKMNFFNF